MALSHLETVDLFERLRAMILAARPRTDSDLLALRRRPGALSLAECEERALGAFLGREGATPAVRREMRALIRRVQTADSRGREPMSPPPETAAPASEPLPPRRVKQVRALLAAVRTLEKDTDRGPRPRDFVFAVSEYSPPGSPSALFLLRRLLDHAPFTRGPIAFRILRALGHDVVEPAKPVRRTLTRLGLLSPPAEGLDSAEASLAALEVLETLGGQTGESVRGIHHLLGLLAMGRAWDSPDALALSAAPASEPAAAIASDANGTSTPATHPGSRAPHHALGVCGARPLCARCELARVCVQGRIETATRRADDEIVRAESERAEAEYAAAAMGVRMTDLTVSARPRERLQQVGAPSLSDVELLAILLRTGGGARAGSGANALGLAQALLKRFGSLTGIDEASIPDLCTVRGIGATKAIELKAALEIGKRILREPMNRGRRLAGSKAMFEALRSRLGTEKREVFLLVALSTKLEVIREIEVSVGTLNESLVHPREVFREAIREAAHAVVLAHNHPSGDCLPSEADIYITGRLVRAGEVLGIKVLDHIIVGRDKYFSFADEGVMPPAE